MSESVAIYWLLSACVFLLAGIWDELRAIRKAMQAMKPFDPLASTNPYGEGLSEGIQNSIVRGQRGISTHD